MENSKLANIANYNKKEDDGKKRLAKALDTISELINIEFGSLTIHFHKGQWCPKVEIQKKVLKELND